MKYFKEFAIEIIALQSFWHYYISVQIWNFFWLLFWKKCFKKMFWLEIEFQLSKTSQCNFFQTQNLSFCFKMVNTKTMQYLSSRVSVNKIKFLYVLCLSLFFRNKANKKIAPNISSACVWVHAHAIACISWHSLSKKLNLEYLVKNIFCEQELTKLILSNI